MAMRLGRFLFRKGWRRALHGYWSIFTHFRQIKIPESVIRGLESPRLTRPVGTQAGHAATVGAARAVFVVQRVVEVDVEDVCHGNGPGKHIRDLERKQLLDLAEGALHARNLHGQRKHLGRLLEQPVERVLVTKLGVFRSVQSVEVSAPVSQAPVHLFPIRCLLQVHGSARLLACARHVLARNALVQGELPTQERNPVQAVETIDDSECSGEYAGEHLANELFVRAFSHCVL